MNKKVPNEFYPNIYNINYQNLKDKGITTLFFDLDNTLIPYDVALLTDEVVNHLKELEKDFKVLIITNNKNRRTKLAVGNNFLFLANAKKPFKCGFKKGLDLTNSTPNEVASIGDQLMTDVIGAKKMGFYSILVNPVDPKSEGIPTKINRFRERCLLKRIKKRDPKLFKERLDQFEPR